MQRRLLDRLACPDCKVPFTLEEEGRAGAGVEGGVARGDGADQIGTGADENGIGADDVVTRTGDIVAGTLRCSGCGFGYPVQAGIPNLLPPAFHRDEVQD